LNANTLRGGASGKRVQQRIISDKTCGELRGTNTLVLNLFYAVKFS